MQRMISKSLMPQIVDATLKDAMIWLSVTFMHVGSLLTYTIVEKNN